MSLWTEKAYDKLPREELWYSKRRSVVAKKYARVVQDMYKDSSEVCSKKDRCIQRWRWDYIKDHL